MVFTQAMLKAKMRSMNTANTTTRFDIATNVAFFLLEKTGSVCGYWQGRLTAKEQRALFGRFIGKGMLHIDGATETIAHTIKVCFGLDYDITFQRTLAEMIREAAPDMSQEDTRIINPYH
jgi:hypothetical protein